jgi:hypothetical protein
MSPSNVTAPTESYVIAHAAMDFVNGNLDVTFNHILDSVVVDQCQFVLTGDSFDELFGSPTDGTTMLSTWITNAIYEAAIAAGAIKGVASPDTGM